MNLLERLIFRRLHNEAIEGGDAGGGTATHTEASASNDQDAPPAAEQKPVPDTQGSDAANKSDVKDKGDTDKPIGAPDKYEFKTAEGQELDKSSLDIFEPVARELNLSNDQAQKLVDIYGSQIMPQLLKQQSEQWQQQTEQWAEAINADKELSSTQSIGNAQKAMDQFGSPELKQYLNDTGLGNHPELVRIFSKIGKSMSEDGFVGGGSESTRSTADVLFGDSK